ncbi:hypothetical protein [Mycobacterium sp. Aquia_213]|uniref:hypothetical protein n=1 Tax=Mycobacterium sp. Aquia_213 TaxID=2991728 RepID=UPI0022700AD8|nr:hypothetical protein [Mycobacterium sp. Aquia_213]WAC90607.1 hypothetical protein LMQ14_22275 [Mycobacterium sp. Aquia_213]
MAIGLGASILLSGVAGTGCASNKSSSPSSTTSSSTSTSSASPSSAPSTSNSGAQPSDYSNLLIKPADIVVPGENFALVSTRPLTDPTGILGKFGSGPTTIDGSAHEVDVSLHIYPDAAGATQEHDQVAPYIANPDMGFTLAGGTVTPADVGTGGAMALGTNGLDAALKQRARVVFSEGRVFAQIEFFNPGNDPLKPDFVLDVARKQDAAIKAALPAA